MVSLSEKVENLASNFPYQIHGFQDQTDGVLREIGCKLILHGCKLGYSLNSSYFILIKRKPKALSMFYFRPSVSEWEHLYYPLNIRRNQATEEKTEFGFLSRRKKNGWQQLKRLAKTPTRKDSEKVVFPCLTFDSYNLAKHFLYFSPISRTIS